MGNLSSKSDRSARGHWLILTACGLISLVALVNLVMTLRSRPTADNLIKLAGDVAWSLLPIGYAVVVALITSRQPRNTIGWLMVMPAIFFVVVVPVDHYLNTFTTAPQPTFFNLFMVWFQNWVWLLLIFPLLFLLLLFPTGKLLTPRWRWIKAAALGMVAFFILMVTILQHLQPSSNAWVLSNPIGWVPDKLGAALGAPWAAGLGLLTVLCAASLFVRYRRSSLVEREQIKWLLYASAVFVLIYIPLVGLQGKSEGIAGDLANLLFNLSTLLFPIAIAIAILRYRLWDIDVIIRRTLIYTVLTAILALVFLGSVLLLQQLFGGITRTENSPFIIVLSTLGIAALFTPLRRGLQDFIDRRFFRKKYNAQKVLESFATSARNGIEMEQLIAQLLSVVDTTLQPDTVSLWLDAGQKR